MEQSALYITFSAYFMGMLFLGWKAYLRTKNLKDYVLGGRSLGPGVTALSAGASDMSGWLLLGLPGAIYSHGLNQLWLAFGLLMGAWACWMLVAKRLRSYSYLAQDALTIPAYLENRFSETRPFLNKRLVGIVSAVVIILFFTIYTASGLKSGALLFEKSFGINYNFALVLGGFIIVSYTFLGGFLAVSWTDFWQGILMLLALVATPIMAVHMLGGMDASIEKVASMNKGYFDLFHEITPLAIVSLMSWGLGYFGQPHIIVRFMGIKSVQQIPTARRIAMSWMVVILIGSVMTGLTGFAYFSDSPLAKPETVFIALTQTLFNPWVAGILLAAILAAVMSTIDSQLLVTSSAFTNDLYQAIFRKKASTKELVLMGRLCVVAVAVIAMFIASSRDNNVLGLVSYAWGGMGAAFGPLILLSLWWKRCTYVGALAGIITGAVVVVVWKIFAGGVVYELLPGFLASFVAVIVFSLLDKRPTPQIEKAFEAVCADVKKKS